MISSIFNFLYSNYFELYDIQYYSILIHIYEAQIDWNSLLGSKAERYVIIIRPLELKINHPILIMTLLENMKKNCLDSVMFSQKVGKAGIIDFLLGK